ncbi:MAG: hypothetical protein HGN29_16250 [Asgard group archaeon]|nr:hypothetical protein [Asgard group archaeon]
MVDRLPNDIDEEINTLTKEEENELRKVLDQMVETVKTYCEKDGKVTASEKRIIKAMKVTTKDLANEIVQLYEEETSVDDLTLLEVVNRNREKILNDLLNAALTPKRKQMSEEAKEVISMVSKDLF